MKHDIDNPGIKLLKGKTVIKLLIAALLLSPFSVSIARDDREKAERRKEEAQREVERRKEDAREEAERRREETRERREDDFWWRKERTAWGREDAWERRDRFIYFSPRAGERKTDSFFHSRRFGRWPQRRR